MLEILFVAILGKKLGQKAQSRGLSPRYGWLIVPYWLVPEIFGLSLLLGLGADLITASIAGLAAGGVGAMVAFAMVDKMSRSAQAEATAPTPSSAASSDVLTGVAHTAGFCSECGETVWLTPNGACSRGHAPEYISGHYTPGK